MSKHIATDAISKPEKKRKLNEIPQKAVQPSDIATALQLQELLQFQEHTTPRLIAGVESFRLFLDSIAHAEDKLATVKQQIVLEDYFELQIPGLGTETEATTLLDIIQIWSFAYQSNNDRLLAAVPATLVLLFKTISCLFNLREYGICLGRILLRKPQLEYISKGLNASNQKEKLISSCLALLAEITSFDGGILAKEVFLARTSLFETKAISRNLSKWAIHPENHIKHREAPSIRMNALRYILALLKFTNGSLKNEILHCGGVWRAVFDHLSKDASSTLNELFDTIKTSVLLNDTISRKAKSRFLNERNLSAIASLFKQYEATNNTEKGVSSSKDIAHEFLIFVCTDPRAGIIQPSFGWYPPGTARDGVEPDLEDALIETISGSDLSDWHHRFRNHVPIANHQLATFAQSLRPYSSNAQSELLIAIFKAVPELVADYFFKQAGFPFDPKLTITWVGYSAFLFAVIQLPISPFSMQSGKYSTVPPPLSVVLENILPRPLHQQVVTKCLNHQNNLISLFAIRITTMAFMKLQLVIDMFTEAAEHYGSVWNEAKAALIGQFGKRCLKVKDIIAAFRSTPQANSIQKDAVLRLLANYYRVTPLIAFEENFEVAIPLAKSLAEFADAVSQENANEISSDNLKKLQTNHLLHIARWSPGMDWWNKPKGLKFSPFVTVLKLFTDQRHTAPQEMRYLLGKIAADNEILQNKTIVPAIDALIASLKPSATWSPSDSVFSFIDDCLNRLKRPIKYEEDSESMKASVRESASISLLLFVIVEQWLFATSRNEASELAKWIGRYVQACRAIGENEEILGKLLKEFIDACRNEEQGRNLTAASATDLSLILQDIDNTNNLSVAKLEIEEATDDKLNQNLDSINVHDISTEEDPSTLHSWSSQDFPTAIASNAVGRLIIHLTSAEPEIRAQALRQLHIVVARLSNPQTQSAISEWRQLHLFLNELIATATPILSTNEPLPHLVASFAVQIQTTLLEPLHPLYEKVNRFLTRGPNWDISRLASYWISKTLVETPSDTLAMPAASYSAAKVSPNTNRTLDQPKNQHWAEVAFLLSTILSGLRKPADLELLRARGSFEPLLALAWEPSLPAQLLSSVIEVVERASMIEGGAGTLVTRTGAVAWARMLEVKVEKRISTKTQTDGRHAEVSPQRLRRLAEHLCQAYEKDRGNEWSGGLMPTFVAA